VSSSRLLDLCFLTYRLILQPPHHQHREASYITRSQLGIVSRCSSSLVHPISARKVIGRVNLPAFFDLTSLTYPQVWRARSLPPSIQGMLFHNMVPQQPQNDVVFICRKHPTPMPPTPGSTSSTLSPLSSAPPLNSIKSTKTSCARFSQSTSLGTPSRRFSSVCRALQRVCLQRVSLRSFSLVSRFSFECQDSLVYI
jgi:hypothetical protein